MIYVTVADVDDLLGPGWAGQFAPDRAVLMANAWLSTRIVRPLPTAIPPEVAQAGAEIAREAAQGNLYQSTGRQVLSTEVSAQTGTSTKKTYAAGSLAMSSGEHLATALIRPWTSWTGPVFFERA
jgi:hypothetical protein